VQYVRTVIGSIYLKKNISRLKEKSMRSVKEEYKNVFAGNVNPKSPQKKRLPLIIINAGK